MHLFIIKKTAVYKSVMRIFFFKKILRTLSALLFFMATFMVCAAAAVLRHAQHTGRHSYAQLPVKRVIKIYKLPGQGLKAAAKLLGTVSAYDTARGLAMHVKLHGIAAGWHGFHLHEYASCANHGKAAGGHWDPQHTHHHLGPYKSGGHLGDLPKIQANKNGQVDQVVVAPHLHVADLAGHSLMVHAGGDNYSDKPAENGGGGARIACGVVR